MAYILKWRIELLIVLLARKKGPKIGKARYWCEHSCKQLDGVIEIKATKEEWEEDRKYISLAGLTCVQEKRVKAWMVINVIARKPDRPDYSPYTLCADLTIMDTVNAYPAVSKHAVTSIISGVCS